MKILYISNQSALTKEEIFKLFQPYCNSQYDLQIELSLDSAKKFLIDNIITKQKHIDLIITDWLVNSQYSNILLEWIRESNLEYSDNNFQLLSLPILLIEDTNSQSSDISRGFNGVLSNFPNNELILKYKIKDVIKRWRYDLADDLDLIGLDPQTQKNYPQHRLNFISYHRLKVLTRKFVDNKAKLKLNYIWTNSNISTLDNANQEFDKKIKLTKTAPPKYLEKEFHKFFLDNPTFLKGEDFVEILYEKHLYKNGTKKYDEVDFINKPHSYTLRKPEIFEVKRHTQRLLKHSKNNFLHKTKKSFEQVKRYKEYMTSTNPLHQYYIKLYLGEVYKFYEYTLLIGSSEEKEEHGDIIEKLKSDFNFNDINLVTYEELLQRHINLCKNLSEFNIF